MTVDVNIVGVGMHPFGRFPEKSLRDLARVATLDAVHDAGLGVKDIQAVYASNSLGGALTGQHQIRGQSVLREVGIENVPVVNVENACAGGSTAFREAVNAVRSESAGVVLALGFEKMFVADRTATLTALQSAGDMGVIGDLGLQFTAVYAMRLRRRLEDGSLTLDDLVAAAIKSHANGALNPYAQHRREVTAAEVLASPAIAEPLTLLMCSSICDGAAAVVVAREGSVPGSGHPRIAIRSTVGRMGYTRASEAEPATATLCARQAYHEAGVGPNEIDVFEVHDAMAPGELLYYEQLELCAPGEAARLLRDGVTQIGGRHPVNPSGGLSSRGHPIGATGLAQLAELTWQLRGEAGARQVERHRLALAQNSGGWLEGEPAASYVHILERVA